MRARLEAERHTDFIWKVKHVRGGLIDVEFIAQALQLAHAHAHPEVLSPNTRTALRSLRDAGVVEAAVADDLIDALDLWQAIQGMLRLTIEGSVGREREADMPEALRATLAKVGGAADLDALKDKMARTAARVHGYFQALIEEPAKGLAKGGNGEPAKNGEKPK